jgi:L-ribulose-5-phosphate 4-epimerase
MVSRSAIREEFIDICQRAFRLGMQVSTGGNISARLDDESFLVKPSGISLHDLSAEDLLVTDRSGHVLEGTGKPTKELKPHLAIYQARKDLKAIVHYHSPYATSFAVLGKQIPLLTVHSKRILNQIPIVPPAEEGSEHLTHSLREAFAETDVRAALMAGHGIMAVGKGLREAQNIAELVEETAKIAFLSTLLSKNPP